MSNLRDSYSPVLEERYRFSRVCKRPLHSQFARIFFKGGGRAWCFHAYHTSFGSLDRVSRFSWHAPVLEAKAVFGFGKGCSGPLFPLLMGRMLIRECHLGQ